MTVSRFTFCWFLADYAYSSKIDVVFSFFSGLCVKALLPLCLRWLPFIGKLWSLKLSTPGGSDWDRFQCRWHREFSLPVNCGVLHGSTSSGSGLG
jgi:hypothetical protein